MNDFLLGFVPKRERNRAFRVRECSDLVLRTCYQQNKLKSSDEVRAVLSNNRGINLFSKFWKICMKPFKAPQR